MKRLLLPILSLLLCLCLLPIPGLAEGTYLSDNPVTHSDFTLALALHPDAFPASTAHLADWAAFLPKLSLKGSIDALDYLQTYSRVYLDAALCLNGEPKLPFIHDGYHSYRFFLSPAVRNDSIHLQMNNFFEFMLKPYYYMELPTQYLALLLYPEASYTLGESYYTPLTETLAKAEPEGASTRTVTYGDLYELAETLDMLANDENDYSVYFYLTCLLSELYAADTAYSALCELESWLDYLDPEQNGLTITESAGRTTMTIGGHTVFDRQTAADGAVTLALTLPDANGYTLAFEYAWSPAVLGARLTATLEIRTEDESRVRIAVDGAGVPKATDLSGEGTLSVRVSGSAFQQEPSPVTLAFDWVRDAAERPYTLDVALDWLHPATEKPAISARFKGTFETVDKSVFVEVDYPQDDFFNLNNEFLEEYKERYFPTLALSAVPFVLEMPAGVLDDIIKLADDTGILLSLGIE